VAKPSAVTKVPMLYKNDQVPKAPGVHYDSEVLFGSEGGAKVSGKSINDTIKGVFCSVMNSYMQQPSWEEILAVSVYQMGSADHIGDVRSFLRNTLKCTASEKMQIDRDWPVCVDINTLLGDHLDELGFTFAEVPRSQTSLPSFTNPFIFVYTVYQIATLHRPSFAKLSGEEFMDFLMVNLDLFMQYLHY
jgi:hypothetical protein